MEAVSMRDFRENLAGNFNRADKGEIVLIRRRNKIYTLTSVGAEDLMLTPELQEKIERVRQEYREGSSKTISTVQQLDNFLDSL